VFTEIGFRQKCRVLWRELKGHINVTSKLIGVTAIYITTKGIPNTTIHQEFGLKGV